MPITYEEYLQDEKEARLPTYTARISYFKNDGKTIKSLIAHMPSLDVLHTGETTRALVYMLQLEHVMKTTGRGVHTESVRVLRPHHLRVVSHKDTPSVPNPAAFLHFFDAITKSPLVEQVKRAWEQNELSTLVCPPPVFFPEEMARIKGESTLVETFSFSKRRLPIEELAFTLEGYRVRYKPYTPILAPNEKEQEIKKRLEEKERLSFSVLYKGPGEGCYYVL